MRTGSSRGSSKRRAEKPIIDSKKRQAATSKASKKGYPSRNQKVAVKRVHGNLANERLCNISKFVKPFIIFRTLIEQTARSGCEQLLLAEKKLYRHWKVKVQATTGVGETAAPSNSFEVLNSFACNITSVFRPLRNILVMSRRFRLKFWKSQAATN